MYFYTTVAEASCVFRKSSLDYGLRITAVIWDALGEWCVGHWRGCELVLTTRSFARWDQFSLRSLFSGLS